MRNPAFPLATMLLIGSTSLLPAQGTLRAAPSTQAAVEVALSYPAGQAPAGADSTPGKIRIEYGQPHLRGRAINTDSLVPFGRPWRTGANASTTLTTTVDLMIGGKHVPKGTYVLWSLPTPTSWQLIVQRSTTPGTMQSAMQYDAANDVARIELARHALPAPIESLSIWLVPSRAPGVPRGELRIAWGSTLLTTDWVVH